jgi:hypothetical protein
MTRSLSANPRTVRGSPALASCSQQKVTTPKSTLTDPPCLRPGSSRPTRPEPSADGGCERTDRGEKSELTLKVQPLEARRIVLIAVGTPITERPPHRSGPARFGHPAPTCQDAVKDENRRFAAPQQPLIGSSAILVHGTALCLLSLGEIDHEDQDLGARRGYSRPHGFRGTLPRRQQDTLERFTAALPRFAAMRKLAMNFRAILFGADPTDWMRGSQRRTPPARTTSGHSLNKFKTLKRSMFGKRTVRRPLAHSDRRLVGALRLRKSRLIAASQVNAAAKLLKY